MMIMISQKSMTSLILKGAISVDLNFNKVVQRQKILIMQRDRQYSLLALFLSVYKLLDWRKPLETSHRDRVKYLCVQTQNYFFTVADFRLC